MSGYLTAAQHQQLLGAINPNRVGRDGKGFSHVEAYEIRAHLNRVFGFARWSADLIDQRLVFETIANDKTSVCYMATVRLTVCAPDGTTLATYTEAATGEAKNQPHRGDAHDLAVKTAESQALKRCAVNLGDAYGLSLYRKGSLAPLVKATLVAPDGTAETAVSAAAPVDAHITEPLPQESEQSEDQRETNPKTPPTQTPPADTTSDLQKIVGHIRDEALNAPPDAGAPFFARLQMKATKAGVMKSITDDGEDNVLTVGALIQKVAQDRKRSAAA